MRTVFIYFCAAAFALMAAVEGHNGNHAVAAVAMGIGWLMLEARGKD